MLSAAVVSLQEDHMNPLAKRLFHSLLCSHLKGEGDKMVEEEAR